MNAENAKFYLPLVQALAEGKTIQYRGSDKSDWVDTISPRLENADPSDFRVKPEPFECWVNFYGEGAPLGGPHKTEAAAKTNCSLSGRTIRMIEAPEQ